MTFENNSLLAHLEQIQISQNETLDAIRSIEKNSAETVADLKIIADGSHSILDALERIRERKESETTDV